MSIFLGVTTFLYAFLLLFLVYGFKKLPNFFRNKTAPETGFSVIIPFRNEAKNLPQLLHSLKMLNYPKELFEIILVNDASEDTSEEFCKNFAENNPELDLKLLQNKRTSGSPKKDALTTGIKFAKKEYIITTDADCMLPQDWLKEFDAGITGTGVEMIAGPVAPVPKNGFLNSFQELDLYSLQAATMGGFGVDLPFMCNGANFCYSKKAFLKVNGFTGNEGIASGDDIFLLEKFRQEGFKTTFLKSKAAVATTHLQPTFKGLISQRIRWAAKTSAYKGFFGKAVGLTVLFMNFGLVLAFVAVAAGVFPFQILFFPFLLKFNVDFLLIYSGAQFFDREKVLKNYFFSSLIYPFFSSYVAILSLFSGYQWKGRPFKK